jgi:hypothetical protein
MVVHPVRTTERVVSHIHGRLPWRWRMFGRPKGKRNPFAAASIYMKSRIFSCKETRGSRPSRAFAFIRQNKDGSSLSRGATSLPLCLFATLVVTIHSAQGNRAQSCARGYGKCLHQARRVDEKKFRSPCRLPGCDRPDYKTEENMMRVRGFSARS